MNDDKLNEIIFLLENIYSECKKQNKDNFFQKFYDGVIIGITSGLVVGFILYLLP